MPAAPNPGYFAVNVSGGGQHSRWTDDLPLSDFAFPR